MTNPFLGRRLMLIGFIAMLFGVLLPFLMVIMVIESTFFLNFLAFGLSIGGLLTGIVGIAMYSAEHRSRREE